MGRLQEAFKMMVIVVCSVLLSVHGLPSGREKSNYHHLNSSSIVAALSQVESTADSKGPASSVQISGAVSGDVASSLESSSQDPSSSSGNIASQANCTESSTSQASGGSTADATASGNCITTIDNSGQHDFSKVGNDDSSSSAANNDRPLDNKVAIGMEGQVNSSANGSDVPGSGGSITQASLQTPGDGSAEAYQMVHGPQATSVFSGIVNSQGDIVHGTQETLMTHNSGDTNIQSLITPFVTAGAKAE